MITHKDMMLHLASQWYIDIDDYKKNSKDDFMDEVVAVAKEVSLADEYLYTVNITTKAKKIKATVIENVKGDVVELDLDRNDFWTDDKDLAHKYADIVNNEWLEAGKNFLESIR